MYNRVAEDMRSARDSTVSGLPLRNIDSVLLGLLDTFRVVDH